MAPRHNGNEGGYTSPSGCFGAFSDTSNRVSFACAVFFFLALLGISVASFLVRKKTRAGKQLLGGFYIVAVLFYLLGSASSIVVAVLLGCTATTDENYYGWVITASVLVGFARYLLLVVFLLTLNDMFRKHFGGKSHIFRLICAILFLMGVLTVSNIALQGQVLKLQATYSGNRSYSSVEVLGDRSKSLNVAYWSLYFFSVLVAGVLSVVSTFSMRSRRQPGGALLSWVVALTSSMFIWTLIALIRSIDYIRFMLTDWRGVVASDFILDLFVVLSFVILMMIAKHRAWNGKSTDTVELHDLASEQPVGIPQDHTHQGTATKQPPSY
ncbi:hypothetical protein P153DRAFT_362358 [Dothidotthia symphoricarpi CBS 119687]|uniref:Uncharacterized protein n=1 Tax=Dothidotthia symphoricarpi CBS 119687 TaxID=1392245 RepID=A0A6A6ATR9_9PLEO|nr:uncharacterized protein P153DRAFT_362358 [Dothidotthia symphoricarpi CBS 119687]KAF2134603.1 hypothetical protein P153DRAFT_362358 [Dothidotthia symphoricarpi CBS 119687]